MSVDLHIHSKFSDGTKQPEELVRLASSRGLTSISITDHDTVEGTGQAMQAGLTLGVEILSGLEISVRFQETPMHILGYGFDWNDSDLLNSLERLQLERQQRNEGIIERLASFGVDVSIDEITRQSGIGQAGRPHIARVMVSKGYVRDLEEAFELYLRRGAKAYVARKVFHAEEAISIIHKANGLSVLAHPYSIDPGMQMIGKLVTQLKSHGLDGLELYYPTHSGKVRAVLSKIARANELITTGGSDYHGEIRPNTMLAGGKNFKVPSEVMNGIRDRLHNSTRCFAE